MYPTQAELGWGTRHAAEAVPFQNICGLSLVFEGGGVEFADSAVGAYYVGEGKGVPVAVGVGWLVEGSVGVYGAPVAAIVGGDVGAVGANGDPGFGGGVVGHGTAVAVGLARWCSPPGWNHEGPNSGNMGIGIELFVVTSDGDDVAMVRSYREDTCSIGTCEGANGTRCNSEFVVPFFF